MASMKRLMQAGLYVAVILLMTGGFLPVSAQTSAEDAAALESWQGALDSIKVEIEKEFIAAHQFSELLDAVNEIRPEIEALRNKYVPLVEDQKSVVAALAADGEDGENVQEDAKLIQEREKQEGILADLEATVKRARVLTATADNMLGRIYARQRNQFAESLLEQRLSLLNPTLWQTAIAGFHSFVAISEQTISVWISSLLQSSRGIVSTLVMGVLLVVLFAPSLLERLVARPTVLWLVTSEKLSAQRLRQSLLAAFTIVISLILVGLMLLVVSYYAGVSDVLPARASAALEAAVSALLLVVFFWSATLALLRSGERTGRFLPVENATAVSVMGIVLTGSGLMSVSLLLERFTAIFFAPLSVFVWITGLSAVVIGLLGLRLARLLFPLAVARARMADGTQAWTWWASVLFIVSLACVLLPLFGFHALAGFLREQIFWIGGALAVLVIMNRLIDDLFAYLFAEDGSVNRYLSGHYQGSRRLAQVAVIFSGLLKTLIFVLVVLRIAASWGVESGSQTLWDVLRRSITGYEIGGVTISAGSVGLVAAVLFGGVWLTRRIQFWLDTRFLPNTELDIGVRNSVKTGIGYLGIGIAIVLAFSFAGVNLDRFAIVAGALSVGIGFGLQSIVNNFVSGLILLAERPIRAGDWISVNGIEGTVKQINVRSTEVETFDRATVIIPNSDLISGTLRNNIIRDRSGRIIVPIGVSYDSDPRQVEEILLACANEHELVLDQPEPYVVFSDFGDHALLFELRCYLPDISYGLTTRSDLRFEIFKRFQAAEIGIPYPQLDVHFDPDMRRTEEGKTV